MEDFWRISTEMNTNYSASLCSMDNPPSWLGHLQECVQNETSYYDRFVCAFLARSIKRIGGYLDDGQPIRMPSLKPKSLKDSQLEEWFNSRDRSGYMRKGEYGYYDRLDMALEKDVKKAKRVGAQIEHREVFETAYNYLVEHDIIEPPVPEMEREHKDLTDDEGQIDLGAVQQGQKDKAIQDALKQLQDTYSKGEFVHNREPVELTNPEVAPDKERPTLNLEIAFGLSTLSLDDQEGIEITPNLQVEESDARHVLVNDFSDEKMPDVSVAVKDGSVLGEVTALGRNTDLRQEYKQVIGNAKAYAESEDLPPESLPAYFVTTRALRLKDDIIEDEILKRTFKSHDSNRPNIVPASLGIHAKLFRAFKELDNGSLDDFEQMLKGLSYAARQHNQSLDEARNAEKWLDDSVRHVYKQIVEEDVGSLRDLTVTITTEDEDEEVQWPLIVDGENIQSIVDELNDLDELMGTADRPFEVDGDLAWDDAIDELYDQAHDLYAGVSELLGHEKRHYKDVKDTLKFPFLLGELRECEREWEKQANCSFAGFVNYFNNATRELPRMDKVELENGHDEIYQELYTKITSKLVSHLEREQMVETSQAYDLEDALGCINNLEDLQNYAQTCFEKADIETECNRQKDDITKN